MNEARIAAIRAARGYTILPVKPGMMLEIHETITDGKNTRVWRFKGLVIKVVKPNHADGTFTVRGKSAWMTVEKIYPLSFPNFAKLVLLDQFRVRRAKLYYIRDKVGKDAKMKSLLTNEDKWVDLLQLAQEDLEKVVAQFEQDQKQFATSDASEENVADATQSTNAPADLLETEVDESATVEVANSSPEPTPWVETSDETDKAAENAPESSEEK